MTNVRLAEIAKRMLDHDRRVVGRPGLETVVDRDPDGADLAAPQLEDGGDEQGEPHFVHGMMDHITIE